MCHEKVQIIYKLILPTTFSVAQIFMSNTKQQKWATLSHMLLHHDKHGHCGWFWVTEFSVRILVHVWTAKIDPQLYTVSSVYRESPLSVSSSHWECNISLLSKRVLISGSFAVSLLFLPCSSCLQHQTLLCFIGPFTEVCSKTWRVSGIKPLGRREYRNTSFFFFVCV